MRTVDVTYRMRFGDDGIIHSLETISEKEVPNDILHAHATDSVNVRKSPVTGTVIGGLVKGQQVNVVDRINGWSHIFTLDDKLNGWSSDAYLEFA